ncbi:MAG TPA: hypothetical protein VJ246_02805, partial [Patescibacteria group bacterium]|nr:hypothetical protein [Patescibacteria group bacterium]
VLSVDGELSSVQTMVKPDINQIVEQVVAPWREHEPDILWHLVSALIVEVVSNHPEVILLSNMQAQRLLAELQQELPPNASIMDVAQWVNPGIIAVRKKVREA